MPLELYSKVIKHVPEPEKSQSSMLNQNIDEATIKMILNLIQEMALDGSSESTDALE